MIQSLFILSPTGEVLIERHFRGIVTSRTVCDSFWEQASRSINHHGGISAATSLLRNEHLYDSVPPVMEVAGENQETLYVFSCLRGGLSYLAVCRAEVSPLLILEFLHRIADTFVDYFGSPADESAVKENFSTVYQLLEEMVDYGWPLTTEPNALKAFIRPPTMLSMLMQKGANVSENLPSGTVSDIPWRTSGVFYSNNEIFVDIFEEIDAIVNSSGTIVSSDISGRIQCQSQLSGVPDLVLVFKDPDIIDDWCFHPCVRYARFENNKVVSFVPPDGNFELMRYRIKPDLVRNITPPVYCHAQWNYEPDPNNKELRKGRITIQVGVAHLSSLIFSGAHKDPVIVEEFAVNIPFPHLTRSTGKFDVSDGYVVYNEACKVGRWNLDKMAATKRASLTCTFTTTLPKEEEKGNDQPNLSLNWKVPFASVSGLSVNGLSMMNESYQLYKGVRNVTKSGMFQIRCD